MSGHDDLFFTARKGEVWACWLGGRPAASLGEEATVREAMKQFLREPANPDPQADTPAPPAELREETRASPPQERTRNERLEERHPITVFGRIYTSGGSREVTVLDLSERGCRVRGRGYLAEGSELSIKLGPIGPIPATAKWSSKEETGLQFSNPLYPSVLQHIREHFNLRR